MWEKEKIYHDGNDYFNDLLNAIDIAKKTIYLEFYIFEFDGLGNKVLKSLVNASQRGVEIKLLLDGFGCSNWTINDAKLWRKKGIAINFFHALPWQKIYLKIWQSLGIKQTIRGLFKFQHRNHRKTCLIDQKILFLGSRNITQVHLTSFSGEQTWRDTCVQLTGPDVRSHQTEFLKTWKFSQEHFGDRWNKIRKQKKLAHQTLVNKICHAKNRVWITNHYFIPDFKFIKALYQCRKSGADVKIILPKNINIPFFKFAVESFYALLLHYKIEIYEYCPSMLHAKVIIIDNWFCVGSSNLDFRSIYYNLETSITLSAEESMRVLEKQFLIDLEKSLKIDIDLWKNRSWIYRLLETVISTLKKYL